MRMLAIPLIAAAMLAAPAGASAALTAEIVGDDLRVTGDGAADSLAVVANGTFAALDFGADNTIDGNFARDDFTTVRVDLGAGEDGFGVTGNFAGEQFVVNGGPGSDELSGSNAVDTLIGGSGDDEIDGQQSNDDVRGGTGADTLRWDPGDGSDTVVDGGGDSALDTLDFNGSNADEIYTATGDGSRVRFTRNLANIVLLIDRIDLIDLESLGGNDNISAAGTAALTHLRIDAGAGADTIATGDGADRIAGGADNDTIDAGAGGDHILAGPGADTALGREGDDGIDGGTEVDSISGGPNSDGCTGGDAGANTIVECESQALPADLVPQPFAHPLEPEEVPADPAPANPEPVDPDPVEEPVVEQPAPIAGFAIDRVMAVRRGLQVALANTGAEPVTIEIAASESVKRKGRTGKRRVAYAAVTRTLAASETATVRLRAPRRHHRSLATASVRKATATVTNLTNGLSETERLRIGR